MDPDANLHEQEDLMKQRARVPTGAELIRRDINHRLRELRVALTDWLKGGGLAPRWNECPKASRYFQDYRDVERLLYAMPELGEKP